MKKRSAHLTRMLIENIYTYSPYKGAKLGYAREYESVPQVNVDLITKIDIEIAIKTLYERKELTKAEIVMLQYVMLDGRLSRRDISAMIKLETGEDVDQRTVSRRLGTAYLKIAKFNGFEYSDSRVFQILAKKLGKPEPYILNDDEIEKAQIIWERI